MFKRKLITPIVLLVTAGFVISGCTTQTEETNEAAPTATKVIVDYGDVLPSGKTVQVTDGTYETVKFDDSNPLYTKSQQEATTNEVATFGFTFDQVIQAQQTALNILVDDYIDNPAVGGTSADYLTWVNSLAKTNKYDPAITDQLETFDTNTGDSSEPTTLVLTRSENSVLPVFVKDGKPRMSDVDIDITKVDATEYDKKPYLEFTFKADTDYRVSDKSVIDAALKASELTNKEDLRGILDDQVFDDEGDNAFAVTSNITLGMQKFDDQWKVVTVTSDYSFDESDYKVSTDKK